MTEKAIEANTATEVIPAVQEIESLANWGTGAPKGGRTVLNRILKDGATVPLFLGQTLVNSLRDLGYSSTTSALCEHVDNAIQWHATEIRVYFHQTGQKDTARISCLVYDNGDGMAPNVLKLATAFGGSLVYDNRQGIGRYGMGMKTAALSMCPAFDVYSWQEPGAIYSMTLDVNYIGNSKSNLIELDNPTLHDELPSEVVDALTKPMNFPKNPPESQELLANSREQLTEQLASSGTIVFMPQCDRLSKKTTRSLVEHATKEMARIYRRSISKGLRLFVNNRRVEAFDPTYSMPSARHTRIEGLNPTHSRLINRWPIEIPVADNSDEKAMIIVRLYALPYEQWSLLDRKVLKSDLQVFEQHAVSFLRNDREVEIGSSYRDLKITRHPDNYWLRLEIEFPGEADEAFGVSANKQGVRVKEAVSNLIAKEIGQDLTWVREAIRKCQKQRYKDRSRPQTAEGERRATDAERLQGKPLPEPSENDRIDMEENLRVLAVTLKREDETDEEALARLKVSTYVTVFKHDEYWPFYHCDFRYGKVILTINTAHPFFEKIWQPLTELTRIQTAPADTGEDNLEAQPDIATMSSEILVGVQSVLLSLARTQSQLCSGPGDANQEFEELFAKLRTEWSGNLATQLTAK
jgi:hypothetical protein